MKLCNVPQDLLAKQVMIDTIPNFAWILVVTGVMAGAYCLFKCLKDNLSGSDVVNFGFAVLVTWIAGISLITHHITTIVTAFANPEYAAMIKFASECVK